MTSVLIRERQRDVMQTEEEEAMGPMRQRLE
jgi:hypothetical protein